MAFGPPPSTQHLAAPPAAPRKPRPMIPPLDLSLVTRIIDGAPVGPAVSAAKAGASEDGLPVGASSGGTGSGSPNSSEGSSGNRGESESEGEVLQVSPEAPHVLEANSSEPVAECFAIGSGAETGTPLFKSSATTNIWGRAGDMAVQVAGYTVAKDRSEHDVGSPLVEGDIEVPERSYVQYVVDRQRRTLLDMVRCGPLRDGQRRLLLAGLVLLQVAIILFALDPGGIGVSVATAAGTQSITVASEAKFLLVLFAACAGVMSLWYCVSVRSSSTGEARDLVASLTFPDEARELAHDLAPPVSQGRDYAALGRIIKDDVAMQSEDRQQRAVAEVVEPRPASFACIADRRRYQHVRGGENDPDMLLF